MGYRPKGDLCMNCTKVGQKCPTNFCDMKKIGRDKDGTIVVFCDNYKKIKDDE